MTINTHRHTARPSRLRVSLARVFGALNRAYEYLDRHIVAFGLTLATLTGVALALMVAFVDDRYTMAGIALAFSIGVAFFVFVATDDATARQRDAYWRASVRRLITKHDDERAYLNTYCDQVAQRNEEQNARNLALLNETKVERDALEEESANLLTLIRALTSPTFADATRDELRVWVMAGNSEAAYARAFHNGEGVSLDDEVTRREAYARLNEATR